MLLWICWTNKSIKATVWANLFSKKFIKLSFCILLWELVAWWISISFLCFISKVQKHTILTKYELVWICSRSKSARAKENDLSMLPASSRWQFKFELISWFCVIFLHWKMCLLIQLYCLKVHLHRVFRFLFSKKRHYFSMNKVYTCKLNKTTQLCKKKNVCRYNKVWVVPGMKIESNANNPILKFLLMASRGRLHCK